jgi:endonuclease VIII
MPEGDTIYRAARTLDKALAGHEVTRFVSEFPQLNRVAEDSPIAGRTVERVEARGKHLLMHFSGGLTLRTHMRMAGSWHIYRAGERWQRPRGHMRIAVQTPQWEAVAFDVQDAEWLRAQDLARSVVATLGPDVLAPDYDPGGIARRMQQHAQAPICDVLLDQRVLAGLGNVYKSELLFLAGVHPLTPVGALADSVLRELATQARKHMLANVRAGAPAGIVTYHGLRRTTGRSDPSERLWVYGRAGKPCRRCATPIASTAIGKHVRRTYHCPRCQPLPV